MRAVAGAHGPVVAPVDVDDPALAFRDPFFFIGVYGGGCHDALPMWRHASTAEPIEEVLRGGHHYSLRTYAEGVLGYTYVPPAE